MRKKNLALQYGVLVLCCIVTWAVVRGLRWLSEHHYLF